MKTTGAILIALMLAPLLGRHAGLSMPSAAGAAFYDDDPLWVEPMTQDVTKATDYEPDMGYEYLVSYLGNFRLPSDILPPPRAANVNTIDEVPDGPIFTNRAGRIALTPEVVVRAANTGEGPQGVWTVVAAKTDGVTPGFTIRDGQGTEWFLKVDPRGWPGMSTGSEIVGAKLFWALGYYTAEYYIVKLVPSNLKIAEGTRVRGSHGGEHVLKMKDIDELLDLTDRAPDGSCRAIASKAIPGTYVGRIRYAGTRRDDPNDVVPHEDRRELRGYFVFAAWLNHVDVKADQSLATVVSEGGHRFIRTCLLDWGSILGAAGVNLNLGQPISLTLAESRASRRRPGWRRQYWQSYEPLFEPPKEIGKRMITFGARIPEWRRLRFYEAPAIGQFAEDPAWDPDQWQPYVSNPAFQRARADDKFWAAYKMTFITEDMIRAVVAEAQFGDRAAEERLIAYIMDRREKILSKYLTALNPIVEPELGRDGRLQFRNAAVEFAGAAAPEGYRASWSSFDNVTGLATPIGVTEAAGTIITTPTLPATPYLRVDLACTGAQYPTWEEPLVLYFHDRAGSWELVGLERMPEGPVLAGSAAKKAGR